MTRSNRSTSASTRSRRVAGLTGTDAATGSIAADGAEATGASASAAAPSSSGVSSSGGSAASAASRAAIASRCAASALSFASRIALSCFSTSLASTPARSRYRATATFDRNSGWSFPSANFPVGSQFANGRVAPSASYI